MDLIDKKALDRLEQTLHFYRQQLKSSSELDTQFGDSVRIGQELIFQLKKAIKLLEDKI